MTGWLVFSMLLPEITGSYSGFTLNCKLFSNKNSPIVALVSDVNHRQLLVQRRKIDDLSIIETYRFSWQETAFVKESSLEVNDFVQIAYFDKEISWRQDSLDETRIVGENGEANYKYPDDSTSIESLVPYSGGYWAVLYGTRRNLGFLKAEKIKKIGSLRLEIPSVFGWALHANEKGLSSAWFYRQKTPGIMVVEELPQIVNFESLETGFGNSVDLLMAPKLLSDALLESTKDGFLGIGNGGDELLGEQHIYFSYFSRLGKNHWQYKIPIPDHKIDKMQIVKGGFDAFTALQSYALVGHSFAGKSYITLIEFKESGVSQYHRFSLPSKFSFVESMVEGEDVFIVAKSTEGPSGDFKICGIEKDNEP